MTSRTSCKDLNLSHTLPKAHSNKRSIQTCGCLRVCEGDYWVGGNQGLSSGEIGVHWDVGVLIQVHMSGNTSKLLLRQCVNSLDLVRGNVDRQSQWLYYYLQECIFSFTLIDDSSRFKEPSVNAHSAHTS